ncbi:unnamed protein product, partial [Meganyctiphanes norvegica]
YRSRHLQDNNIQKKGVMLVKRLLICVVVMWTSAAPGPDVNVNVDINVNGCCDGDGTDAPDGVTEGIRVCGEGDCGGAQCHSGFGPDDCPNYITSYTDCVCFAFGEICCTPIF